MSKSTPTKIEEILRKIVLEMNFDHRLNVMMPEATQAIKQLITKAETEARIDELGYVQTEYGGRFLATTYADGDGQTIEARIEGLKQQGLKGKHD